MYKEIIKRDKIKKIYIIKVTIVEIFENIILENGDDLISESGTSCIGDEDSSEYYVKSYLRINDPNVDKIELKIGWIMKSKIEGNSIELIEK